jgi:hypothetical protein
MIRDFPSCKAQQNGYALLLIMFFLAALALTLAAATPNLLTQGRREKEKEMVWRGKQYVRGINLYYKKYHRFPQQLEDLYKAKTGIRFMRQEYKDPLNSVDGSWRLIYVAPDGRIVGSLRKNQNMYFGAAPPPAGSQAALVGNSFSSSSFFAGSVSPPASAGLGSFSSSPFSSGPQSSFSSSSTQNQSPALTSLGPDTPPLTTQTPPTTAPPDGAPIDDSTLPKTNTIIGVGSKINKNSFLWLDGEKNYLQFEFVWTAKEAQVVGH